MRISLNWLQELVDISLSPEVLADTLTMAGFEVEDIEDRRTWADGVVVGKVLSREPHPNADKLSVCQVDIGAASPSTIVCGAANVQADIYVPVATVGTYLPMVDLKIKPRKLRNVPSAGMICSLAEVGLAKDSEGIHIFTTADLQPGIDARPLLGLDDVVLDLTSTANRADALSMVGIAREVAAITGAALKLPVDAEIEATSDKANLAIDIEAIDACPLYIGTAIEQIKIGPSPMWLQRRLQAAGTRPINNVVDITNYVLLEWGQPLHAFDKDRLQTTAGGDELTLGVRLAQTGEALTTLDSQLRQLQEQTLVITANNQPVALAGVMGGESTEVQADTQNLVLEAAYFESAVIRRSARSQGLRTEASARYERGVNPAELAIACRRAIQLITELAGGVVTTQAIAAAPRWQASHTRTIELRLDRVNQVLGPVRLDGSASTPETAGDDPLDLDMGELSPEEIQHILKTLGCEVKPAGQDRVWTVMVPPYRQRDLEREIDLIEEIARLYGYNNFCDTLPAKTEPGYLSLEAALTTKLREAFRAAGLTELMHYSLVKPIGGNQVVLANPLFAEYSALRSDLLSGLIDAAQYNLEKGNGILNGFEIGHVFWVDEAGLDEKESIAGIFGGDNRLGRWVAGGREQPMTWFEAKGVLESIFSRLSLAVEYQPDRRDPRLHPGRTASLWLGGTRLGTFGQLHPQLQQEKDLPAAVYAFEMDLDVLLDNLDQEENLVPVFQAYASYPASDRDLAFFAPTQLSVAEIERLITKTGGQLLESVELFDEYQGQNVPDGQRSLAFRLLYRASDRTLTEADIEPVHQKIREALAEKFGVSLRS
ncbi:MAG: phenylalanine--tRNA ligase subunit beta [Cyanothece sp. SIO1E1]|nr:phenylalanine--tRNA ligase subunit beta [Cyanothece sp. SIO1E1]